MNKMMKKGAVLLGVTLALSGLTACKDPVADDQNTLYIYMAEAGFGGDWLPAVAEAFEKEYPDYNVELETEKGVDRVEDMLRSGPENTTHDLLFGREKLFALQAQGEKAYAGYDCVLENLTDMYESEVPGEGVTLAEKTNQYTLKHFAIEEEVDGVWKDQYYMYSWSNSLMGLVYNKTVFEEHSLSVPRTTEEMYEVCDTLKKDIMPFISSHNVSYWDPVCDTWWAQYDSVEEHDRYWNPTSLSDYETMSQKGKLYAAQIANQIYNPKYGREHGDSISASYTEAQAKFIIREAAIIPCGDWFENEMKDIIAQQQAQGVTDEFEMMKTPLNSAIVEKLSFWTGGDYSTIFQAAHAVSSPDATKLQTLRDADDKLQQIVDYVDGVTTTKPAFASDDDIQIVAAARNVAFTYGSGHQAVIPAYATAKEAAKKFLLFLATDRAQKIFAENTSGTTMCYGYDPADDGVEMSNFARSALDIVKDAVIAKHYSISKGYWAAGLYDYRLSFSRMASEHDYLSPEYIYEDGIMSYDEYATALRTGGII